jgi:hypothetical protein
MGYDGPINADDETPIADLGTVLTGEMVAELDDVIAKTRADLNETQEPAGESGRVRRTRSRVPANA